MKKNIFNTVVPFNYHGYRVDKFLQVKLKELSRTRIQNLVNEGQVKLNNIIVLNSSKKIKEIPNYLPQVLNPKEWKDNIKKIDDLGLSSEDLISLKLSLNNIDTQLILLDDSVQALNNYRNQLNQVILEIL